MIKLFLALAGSRGTAAILLLVTNILFARLAGPQEFGSTSIVLSFSTFLFVALDFGMSSYIIRATARKDDARVKAALYINGLTSVLGALLISAIIVIIAPFLGYSNWLAILGAALALEKSADTILGIHIARSSKRVILITTVTRRLLTLLVFLCLSTTVINISVAYSLSFFVGGLVSWLIVRLSLSGLDTDATRLPIMSLLKEGTPFFLANVSAGARNVDVALVGVLTTASGAGYWSAAQKLTTPFMLLSGALSSVVLPEASRRKVGGIRSLSRNVVLLHVGLVLLLIPVAVMAERIIYWTLGTDYIGAAPILFWSLLAYPLIALSSTLGGILQGNNDEKFVAMNGLYFAILLVVGLSAFLTFLPVHYGAFFLFILYFVKCVFLILRIRSRTA